MEGKQMKNRNTELLWNKIKRMGRFSDSYYDKNIETDMRIQLGLSESVDLNEVSPEKLLSAFFEVMAPLSLMYEDILNLFIDCKANSSTNNIEIEFQSTLFNSTRLNVENFVHAKEILQRVKEQQKSIFLNKEDIYKLWDLFPYRNVYSEDNVKDNLFIEWKALYLEDRANWPDIKLTYETIAMRTEIGSLLIKCYEFWKQLFSYYKLCIPDRKYLKDYFYSKNKPNFDILLIQQETDLYLHHILSDLYIIAENYPVFSDEIKNTVQKNLEEFLSELKIIEINVEVNKKTWKEFLSLPVWQKRYEVYSVWVFAKMVSVFPSECMTYYVQNNKLVFPFSGARLASIKLNEKVFDIWTELKTKAIVKPIGKGRKKAIQPDYSIVFGDKNKILDTLLVVECKQYKKANIKNFSEAIIDYAANRPKAKVLLVDYGEINIDNITSAMESLSACRYEIYSKCRPRSINVQNFANNIYKIVSQYAKDFEFNFENPISFALLWDGIIRNCDLDLHLIYKKEESSNEIRSLSYSHNEISNAKYSGDVQIAPGIEYIIVNRWKKGIYDLWVNNYTKGKFTDCHPVVIVKSKEITKVIELETENQEDSLFWWHILKIDTNSNICYIINELEQQKIIH